MIYSILILILIMAIGVIAMYFFVLKNFKNEINHINSDISCLFKRIDAEEKDSIRLYRGIAEINSEIARLSYEVQNPINISIGDSLDEAFKLSPKGHLIVIYKQVVRVNLTVGNDIGWRITAINKTNGKEVVKIIDKDGKVY